MSLPPLLTPSEAHSPVPRARGACRPGASPRPERSTQYLRQPTPAHVAYRRFLLLQKNLSQPGHSFRYSSKFLHFPYIGSCPIESDVLESFYSGQITRSQIDYCCFLNKSWKMSRPQVWPRACTSAPPSLNFPSLTGAKPSCLAKSATGAIASSSSLDKKTTRWPPSTIGSVASVAAIK